MPIDRSQPPNTGLAAELVELREQILAFTVTVCSLCRKRIRREGGSEKRAHRTARRTANARSHSFCTQQTNWTFNSIEASAPANARKQGPLDRRSMRGPNGATMPLSSCSSLMWTSRCPATSSVLGMAFVVLLPAACGCSMQSRMDFRRRRRRAVPRLLPLPLLVPLAFVRARPCDSAHTACAPWWVCLLATLSTIVRGGVVSASSVASRMFCCCRQRQSCASFSQTRPSGRGTRRRKPTNPTTAATVTPLPRQSALCLQHPHHSLDSSAPRMGAACWHNSPFQVARKQLTRSTFERADDPFVPSTQAHTPHTRAEGRTM